MALINSTTQFSITGLRKWSTSEGDNSYSPQNILTDLIICWFLSFLAIDFICSEIIGIDYFLKVFVRREIIGIEYLNEVREMNHWAFGPHHMWTDIVTGNIIRYHKLG